MELTILMPCLNEEKTIESCIKAAQQFIDKNKLVAEILIADNGSTDDSVNLAKRLGARVVHIAKKGYGSALRGGIEAAKGKYIIMGDCDMSYDFVHLDLFLEALRQGNGLVMGNRFRGGIQKGAMPFLHQYFGVPLLSFVGRSVYGTQISDFHCGQRGFDKEAILSLHLSAEGMEFATEMIGAFARSDFKIVEIPVVLNKDCRDGKSHLRSFRDGFRHLDFMLKAALK
ncbi:glycosyltransferase family 2 protein [Sporanaerobium hydrogeniformans]|uniref:glycosyltransferase family 2 protein n=1 Tax=Sporanaerobium hydrogeniformans TaxID=3072179 RepID=UPI0015D4AAEF|nr:glycosyltransferase family 2 protein [Sporanaerobium hydrogeniformans]